MIASLPAEVRGAQQTRVLSQKLRAKSMVTRKEQLTVSNVDEGSSIRRTIMFTNSMMWMTLLSQGLMELDVRVELRQQT